MYIPVLKGRKSLRRLDLTPECRLKADKRTCVQPLKMISSSNSPRMSERERGGRLVIRIVQIVQEIEVVEPREIVEESDERGSCDVAVFERGCVEKLRISRSAEKCLKWGIERDVEVGGREIVRRILSAKFHFDF